MSRIGDSENGGAANLKEAAHKVGESLRDLGGQVREAAREEYEQVSGKVRDYCETERKVAREWERELKEFVQEKPMEAVLIAAGVGLLVRLLLGRR